MPQASPGGSGRGLQHWELQHGAGRPGFLTFLFPFSFFLFVCQRMYKAVEKALTWGYANLHSVLILSLICSEILPKLLNYSEAQFYHHYTYIARLRLNEIIYAKCPAVSRCSVNSYYYFLLLLCNLVEHRSPENM